MAKIRVVLADDHPALIATVRQVLDHYCEIVEAVEDGQQAVDAVMRLTPDVLVIDITMPVMDGLAGARRLQDLRSPTRVVFLTMHEDRDFVEAAFLPELSDMSPKPASSLTYCLRFVQPC